MTKLSDMKPALLAEHLAQCTDWPKAARAVFKRGVRARLRSDSRQAPADAELDELDPWHNGWDAADRILEVDQA